VDGDGYFFGEARRLLAALPEGGLRRRLQATAAGYREALAVQALHPGRVDRIEDDLQDLFEQAAALLDEG